MSNFVTQTLLFFVLLIEIGAQHSFSFPERIGDWEKEEEQGRYAGDDLYKLIDGGADIFFEYGFDEVITQKYSAVNNIVSIEVYCMKTPEAAYGIYSLKSIDTGRKIKVGDDGVTGESYIMLRKGRYFITLTSYEDNKSSREGLLVIAEKLSSGIYEDFEQPEVCRLLLTKKFPHRQIAFIKGNMGLYNLYFFDSQNIFGVKEGAAGKSKSELNFIFKYTSQDDCIQWFRNGVSELQKNEKLKMINSQEGTALFLKGKENIFIAHINKFIIISVSSKRTEAKQSAKILSGILTDQK